MKKKELEKLNDTANFIEELSWLLEKRKNFSLRDMSDVIRMISNEENISFLNYSKNNNRHKNSQYLVGILPSLFLDNELFNRNDILDFAESVLGLPVSRAAKRSKTEYIGWIVCEITKLDENQLNELVGNLENIVGDEGKIKKIKKAKSEPNFSWNEAISKLSKM